MRRKDINTQLQYLWRLYQKDYPQHAKTKMQQPLSYKDLERQICKSILNDEKGIQEIELETTIKLENHISNNTLTVCALLISIFSFILNVIEKIFDSTILSVAAFGIYFVALEFISMGLFAELRNRRAVAYEKLKIKCIQKVKTEQEAILLTTKK